MLIKIFNWFVKITGWLPQRIVFNTKVYYQDRSVQGRHIKGAAVIASNHTSVFDYAALLFVFSRARSGCRWQRCSLTKSRSGCF